VYKGLAKSPAERYQQCADMRGDLEQVRRALHASALRTLEAARERYREILGLIEERRAIGRGLGVPDVDASCDDAVARIAGRFPAFAADEDGTAWMDRAAANAALAALQDRRNAEQAAVAALRERAAAVRTQPVSGDRSAGAIGGFWRDLFGKRDS
jgi:hypothetical protein